MAEESKMFLREREVAIRAVVEASLLCSRIREQMLGTEALTKGDRTPVTVADFSSQALICRSLRNAFPMDAILAEEDSRELSRPENKGALEKVVAFVKSIYPDSTLEEICSWIDQGCRRIEQRYWALDPIDGTKGFLRNDQYAIALALVVEGRVRLGVLGCPNLPYRIGHHSRSRGCIFFAVRGDGARQMALGANHAEHIHVSEVDRAARARFCESFESGHTNHEAHSRVARLLGISAPPVRMDSQAKYGVLARGEASIYLRLPAPGDPAYREKVWDHAAGSIIIEEAGGRVTDIHGKPLNFASGYLMEKNRGVIATNGVLHEVILDAVGKQL